MNSIEKFLTCVLNNYQKEESNNVTKYYNSFFDVIVHNKQCVIFDKRNNTIYYDIQLALQNLCT